MPEILKSYLIVTLLAKYFSLKKNVLGKDFFPQFSKVLSYFYFTWQIYQGADFCELIKLVNANATQVRANATQVRANLHICISLNTLNTI